MVARGQVNNGVVVLANGVRLPEGQEVTVLAPGVTPGIARPHGILDIAPVSLGAVRRPRAAATGGGWRAPSTPGRITDGPSSNSRTSTGTDGTELPASVRAHRGRSARSGFGRSHRSTPAECSRKATRPGFSAAMEAIFSVSSTRLHSRPTNLRRNRRHDLWRSRIRPIA